MPFALGVAVAELFARIAAALKGQTVGGVNPLPPSPPRPQPTPQPPPAPPPSGPPIIPEPPFQGTPIPVGPLPTVPTPGSPLVTVPSVPIYCSPIPLSQRMALYALEVRGQDAGPVPITSYTPEVVTPVPALTTQANGTPIEAQDVFRFRAVTTSDIVTVSFYGRVMLANGTIVPFVRTLRTAVVNTLYETTMQGATGYLLGAAASVPVNSITAGSVNAVGEIGRMEGGTFVPHTLLFGGQLDDLTPLSDAVGSLVAPVERPTFKFALMTAGAGVSATVDITPASGKRIRVCFISGDYNCSAVAGNRHLNVVMRNTSMTLYEGWADQMVTASQIGVHRCSIDGAGVSPSAALPANFREIALRLPTSLYFYTTTTVSVGAAGEQAGDTYSPGFVRYEES